MLTIILLIDRNLSPPWGRKKKRLRKTLNINFIKYIFGGGRYGFTYSHSDTDGLILVSGILERVRESLIFLC